MRTLLIVDDERIIREGIAGSCNWNSLHISRVLLAANGKDAYEIIIKERPDIVFIDIIMPEMTGFEVISRFANTIEGPEFVIISGYEDFQYAQEAIRYNVNNYLLKPCDPLEIETTIKKILHKLDRRQSMADEKSHLKEYVDLIMPEAQEQILRNFLLNNDSKDRSLFEKVFGQCCEEFQIILFSVEDRNDYIQLLGIKECLDIIVADILCWNITAIVRDRIVLVFDQQEAEKVKDIPRLLYQATTINQITGVVSSKGTVDNLPSMYVEVSEASRRLPLYKAGQTIPLLHVSATQYSEPIRRILQYITENLSDSSLSLNHIASNILFHNPDYLGKLFKKECGVKFSDYLMQLRIEQAKQIISSSAELKIYEVANRIGLGNSTAYFGQVFRKYTGMLPSEYRDIYWKKKSK